MDKPSAETLAVRMQWPRRKWRLRCDMEPPPRGLAERARVRFSEKDATDKPSAETLPQAPREAALGRFWLAASTLAPRSDPNFSAFGQARRGGAEGKLAGGPLLARGVKPSGETLELAACAQQVLQIHHFLELAVCTQQVVQIHHFRRLAVYTQHVVQIHHFRGLAVYTQHVVQIHHFRGLAAYTQQVLPIRNFRGLVAYTQQALQIHHFRGLALYTQQVVQIHHFPELAVYAQQVTIS